MNPITEYFDKTNWQLKENANASFSLSGLKSYIASQYLREHALNTYPAGKAHRTGALYIHDLGTGIYSPYCYGADLFALIKQGIRNPFGASSKPAKHFDVLIDHMVNFLYTSQQEFAGAQAFDHVDTYLAPFVAFDKLSYEEVKQGIQRLIYNLNYPLRSSFQTPFTNLTFDLIVPKKLGETNVYVNGEKTEFKFKDFQDEVDIVNRAFLEIMLEGDAKGNPFTFPIPTYNVTSNFPWNSPNSDLIFELTAKFGLPYFMNYINSQNSEEDIRAMCCRLHINTKQRKGLWNFDANTGSIGVVSINMPQLGYLSKNEDDFFNRLDDLLTLAFKQLKFKREMVEKALKTGLLPFTSQYLKTFNAFFVTLGIIGMHEFCVNFYNSPIFECRAEVINILDYINARISEQDDMINFEATPAESAAYSLAKRDKAKFKDIYTSGTEVPFYTNSTNVPVDVDLDLISRIEVEEQFQIRYTGGTVFHIFHGQHLNGAQARDIIRSVCENTEIPYLDLTPTYSICKREGIQIFGIHETCPRCGSEAEIYSRVTGYYRPVSKWNPGKREEFKNRLDYLLG